MISVLCPTRGRPDNVRRLVQSAQGTATGNGYEFVFRIDADDPAAVPGDVLVNEFVVVAAAPRARFGELWNECAESAAGDILMCCGDDIVFRTDGWDTAVEEAFRAWPDRIGLVYGNDMHHGANLSTHPFVHENWVRAVGYFTPPYFSHDYVDNWLFDVAGMTGRRVYLPDVVTEHMHPQAGKAAMDATYAEGAGRGGTDNVAGLYQALAGKREEDAAKLREAMQ